MNEKIDVMLLYRVANDYYINNLTQKEIAEKEFMSRSQISRLLVQAKKLGIVKYQIGIPEILRHTEISKAIEKKLNLDRVVIASNPTNLKDADFIAKTIATLASVEINKLIKDGSVVGLGWGKTLYHFSLQFPYGKKVSNSTIYIPLIGLTDTMNPYLQINNIIDRIAEKQNSERFYMHLPFKKSKKKLYSNSELKRLTQLRHLWSKMNTAIIGLGSKNPGPEMFGYDDTTELYYKEIINKSALGEILGQFFDGNGSRNINEIESNEFLSFDINTFKEIDNVICLAGGENKVEGIIAAANNKYFNQLYTDQYTAELILGS